jgi:hypothetical protein
MKRVAVIVACVACLAGAVVFFAGNDKPLNPVRAVKQHMVKKMFLADMGLYVQPRGTPGNERCPFLCVLQDWLWENGGEGSSSLQKLDFKISLVVLSLIIFSHIFF